MTRLVKLAALLPLATLAPSLHPADAQAPASVVETIRALKWRPIGPANMGGRVTAIEGVPGNPLVFWVGGADGGVFRTTDGGITFQEQFTDQPVYSVGALALAPSDQNVLWLGSGEGDPRNSASYGNGVYRSTDGGATWKHLGLGGTERIKRVVVHPANPDHAYVCALGRAWGPNAERGVFRTRDGGKTWDKVLYRNDDTGCSDLALDVTNPRILYAGMWTFRRRPWRFDDGGPETALYKSVDGGDTWTRLTNGMPKGDLARIGVAVSRTDPNVVYFVSETVKEGTLFRSDDAGAGWRMVNDNRNINFRPFYYSDIRVDPNNADVLYSLSGGLFKSTDGGKTFQGIGQGVHGDHQALWIDPANSHRLLSGSDGGYQVSNDGGRNWDIINNVTLSQFYHVAYDNQRPYHVCGGLQDNGSWCGPSATTNSAGILKDDWFTVSGGDGFFAVPVKDQPHLVYSDLQGGVFFLTDLKTNATRQIHPYPNKIGSAGDAMLGHKYRFNWDAPIEVSPHDLRTVYIGGNVVFKSTDLGHSWRVISPDLTTNDTAKQLSSGGKIYTDNTAAEFHTTILTIAESPVQGGVIWAGTDDGKVWVTRDGGIRWTDVTRNIRGFPAFGWVSRIDASHHDAGTAYVAVDQHRMDDLKPYAFKLTGFGATAENLSAGLPQDDFVRVVREDPGNRSLLFAGMERGLHASWDAGTTWVSIRNGLPPVSIHDLQIHKRDGDLIIGTHGRGVYIMDDIGPLRGLASAMTKDAHVFDVRPAVLWQIAGRDASLGQRVYRAPNPPFGAYLNYYLKAKPDQPIKATITDAAGAVVRELTDSASAGVNRLVWDLRHTGPDRAQPPGGPGGGGGGFGFGARGPLVVPGEYTATFDVPGQKLQARVRVEPDPRVNIPPEHYVAQRDAAIQVRDLLSRANRLVEALESVERQVRGLMPVASSSAAGNGSELEQACKAALQEIEELKDKATRPPPRMGYRQAPRLREELQSLFGTITAVASRPTEGEMTRLGELQAETTELETAWGRTLDGAIRRINQLAGGMPRIATRP
jgi:photosystem II stability/assembly factor-like uncharacterized protein